MGKGEIGPPTFWLLPPPMTSGQGNLTQGRIAAAHRACGLAGAAVMTFHAAPGRPGARFTKYLTTVL